MSSEKSDDAVPSVSPGSFQSSASSTTKATSELMNVSPLLGNDGEQTSSGSTSMKDALRKREWLQAQLHQVKVQLHMKKSGISRFIPKFLKWTLPSLNLVRTIVLNRGHSQKSKQNGNNVDPDEKAHYAPSHQDLHC